MKDLFAGVELGYGTSGEDPLGFDPGRGRHGSGRVDHNTNTCVEWVGASTPGYTVATPQSRDRTSAQWTVPQYVDSTPVRCQTTRKVLSGRLCRGSWVPWDVWSYMCVNWWYCEVGSPREPFR